MPMSAQDPPAALPTLPRPPHPVLEAFHPPVREWFTRSFEAPTGAQELAWPLIQAGQSALILAPTGSGKTLAAFLAAIDRLMFDPVPPKEARCRVLYVSPLKALAVDVERNLRAPLVGISRYAERMGVPFHPPEVAIRTGDTPSRERARFNRNPDDILITTPESLYLLLTSNAREALRSVRHVIIDEIHAVVGTKRGAHLSLSLERLEELESPLNRFVHLLHPYVAFLIMPLFALANSGVPLAGIGLEELMNRISLGAALGLFLGKQLGIFFFTLLAVRLGLAPMPGGASRGKLYGVALIAGIGFTVALFIAGLAFPDQRLLDYAKIGILLGSLASGVVGFLILRFSAPEAGRA